MMMQNARINNPLLASTTRVANHSGLFSSRCYKVWADIITHATRPERVWRIEK
jgi:hypothetical protein